MPLLNKRKKRKKRNTKKKQKKCEMEIPHSNFIYSRVFKKSLKNNGIKYVYEYYFKIANDSFNIFTSIITDHKN